MLSFGLFSNSILYIFAFLFSFLPWPYLSPRNQFNNQKPGYRVRKESKRKPNSHNKNKERRDYKNRIELKLKKKMACHSASAISSSSLRITNSMPTKPLLSFPPTSSRLLPFHKSFTFLSLRSSTKPPTKSFQGSLFFSYLSFLYIAPIFYFPILILLV